jgi:dihydroneopterin aldolase
MDKIFLRELTIEAIIGFYDWERKVKQTLVIDLDIGTDVRATASHDDIDRTLNYKAVAKRVLAFVGDSQYRLIETLAEELAQTLLQEFKMPWLRIVVHKPGAIRHSRDVGIEIERTA